MKVITNNKIYVKQNRIYLIMKVMMHLANFFISLMFKYNFTLRTKYDK